jgi:hypothetical protein
LPLWVKEGVIIEFHSHLQRLPHTMFSTPNWRITVIQATPNLTPPVPWQAVSTNIANANGVWLFTQTHLTISPRFYRFYAR